MALISCEVSGLKSDQHRVHCSNCIKGFSFQLCQMWLLYIGFVNIFFLVSQVTILLYVSVLLARQTCPGWFKSRNTQRLWSWLRHQIKSRLLFSFQNLIVLSYDLFLEDVQSYSSYIIRSISPLLFCKKDSLWLSPLYVEMEATISSSVRLFTYKILIKIPSGDLILQGVQ